MADIDSTDLKGPDGTTITLEPISALKTESPHSHVLATESGHYQIFDDTVGAEVIRTQHKSGSYTEIRPDGTEVHKIVGDGWHLVAKNNRVVVNGFCQVTINGDSNLTVRGNVCEYIEGNHDTLVNGDYNLIVKGKTNITSAKNMEVGVANPTGGKLKLLAGDSFVVNSDLVVNGAITGDSVHSTGAITAATGIHAGLPGSLNPVAGITTLGGINAGVPPVTPTVPGVVTGTVMVAAPSIIGYALVFAPLLLDFKLGLPGMRLAHNIHAHHAKGVGTPIIKLPLP